MQVIEELRELDVGELDGRRDEQAWACYRQVLDDWHAGRHETAFPGSENYQQMTTRLASAFLHALRHPAGSRVLLIGHGGIIRAAVPALCPGTPMPPLISRMLAAYLSAHRTIINGGAFASLWP